VVLINLIDFKRTPESQPGGLGVLLKVTHDKVIGQILYGLTMRTDIL
jgi:hypothetical protein